jgi:hypothetical protein
MIGNAQTAVEREQSVQKLFQLMGSPAFQTIVQRPEFPAGEFFIWILNELNYRQANTLTTALGIGGAISQEAYARGVEPGDIGRFVGNMERGIKGAIPEFANMLEEQEAMGEIPKPREVADEVREDIIV